MPTDTSLISTPVFSHKFASSLMYEIFVARNALEAYFISSAPLLEVLKYLFFFLIIGKYRDCKILLAFLLFVPTTTLSGYIKSLMASPSRKNSGFDTTSTSLFFF